MHTAFNDSASLIKSQKVGMKYYLPKPYKLGGLTQLLEKVFPYKNDN